VSDKYIGVLHAPKSVYDLSYTSYTVPVPVLLNVAKTFVWSDQARS